MALKKYSTLFEKKKRENHKEKLEVEKYLKDISQLLKDPNKAKKAALIIEQMLKNSK